MNGLARRRLILYSVCLRSRLMLRNLAFSLLDVLLIEERVFSSITLLLSKHICCIRVGDTTIIGVDHSTRSRIGH